MSRFDSHPSAKERLLRRFVPVTLLGATAITGVSACGSSSETLEPKPGDILCKGVQEVVAQPGQTFSELIDNHITTDVSPTDFHHLQLGIEFEYDRIEGVPATFIIPAGRIETPHVELIADKTYELPISCDMIEESK